MRSALKYWERIGMILILVGGLATIIVIGLLSWSQLEWNWWLMATPVPFVAGGVILRRVWAAETAAEQLLSLSYDREVAEKEKKKLR